MGIIRPRPRGATKGRIERPGSAEIAAALRVELEVGALRTGAALPPVDDLRRRFGAGEYAVRHALQQLRDEGLIVLRSRTGARATGKAQQTWKGTVAFVCQGFGSFYHHSMALHFGRRIEEAGWRCVTVFMAIDSDGTPDISPLQRHLANGIDFVVGVFDRPMISDLLSRAGVRHVVVNGFARDFPKADAVMKCDHSTAFGELIAALKSANVKSILEFDFERITDRYFKVQLLKEGFDVRRLMHTVATPGRSDPNVIREAGYREVTDYFAGGSHRFPDAILFDDDYFATGGIFALRDAGLRIPEDVRVASFMNKGNESTFGRRITGFGYAPAEDGPAIADYVAQTLAGGHPRPPVIRWRYFPGDSL